MAAKSENKPLSLEDVQAQIQEMLTRAQEKADRIVSDAEKKAQVQETPEAKRRKADKERGDELVEVKLFKDNHKYKDPVFVAVNGENCVIQRGVRVKIKRKFAEVLDNSDIQDYEASRYMDERSSALDNAPI